jgi:hypothetical protein
VVTNAQDPELAIFKQRLRSFPSLSRNQFIENYLAASRRLLEEHRLVRFINIANRIKSRLEILLPLNAPERFGGRFVAILNDAGIPAGALNSPDKLATLFAQLPLDLAGQAQEVWADLSTRVNKVRFDIEAYSVLQRIEQQQRVLASDQDSVSSGAQGLLNPALHLSASELIMNFINDWFKSPTGPSNIKLNKPNMLSLFAHELVHLSSLAEFSVMTMHAFIVNVARRVDTRVHPVVPLLSTSPFYLDAT